MKKSLRTHYIENWTWWDDVTAPFHRLKIHIRDAYYNLKYRCQRFAKGYADVDVFEFAFNLIPHIEGILKEFIECHHGYPGDSTPEKYDEQLELMLYHLQWMDEDKVTEEVMKSYDDYCTESFEEINKELEYHTDEFFKLFRELFWTLWD